MDHYPSNVSRESDASSHTLTEVPTNRSIVPTRPPHWRLVQSHSLLVQEVVEFPYNGSGTADDPFVVEYIPHDPRDPMGFTMAKKWFITVLVAVATLTVRPKDRSVILSPRRMLIYMRRCPLSPPHIRVESSRLWKISK